MVTYTFIICLAYFIATSYRHKEDNWLTEITRWWLILKTGILYVQYDINYPSIISLMAGFYINIKRSKCGLTCPVQMWY